MQIWIQVHGLSMEMFNQENAHRIGNNMGRCLAVEPDHVMRQRSFLRLKLEIDIAVPLTTGFWWSNAQGENKWASVKFERLSDVYYVCGRLGHTSQQCGEYIVMSELKPDFPLYGPGMSETRPRTSTKWHNIGGGNRQPPIQRDANKKS